MTRFEAQVRNSSQMGSRSKNENKHSSPDKIGHLQDCIYALDQEVSQLIDLPLAYQLIYQLAQNGSLYRGAPSSFCFCVLCFMFSLVCACVNMLHNQFSWLIEIMKHDMAEKVVDNEKDCVWIMVEESFLWKKHMSILDAPFCPGYYVCFCFWALGPFVTSFELGPRTLSFSFFFV